MDERKASPFQPGRPARAPFVPRHSSAPPNPIADPQKSSFPALPQVPLLRQPHPPSFSAHLLLQAFVVLLFLYFPLFLQVLSTWWFQRLDVHRMSFLPPPSLVAHVFSAGRPRRRGRRRCNRTWLRRGRRWPGRRRARWAVGPLGARGGWGGP